MVAALTILFLTVTGLALAMTTILQGRRIDDLVRRVVKLEARVL